MLREGAVLQMRKEAPRRYKGKIVECNCNSDWYKCDSNVPNFEFLSGKHEGYYCPKCTMYAWVRL